MDWIYLNVGNIVVGTVVFAAVLGAIVKIKTSDEKTGCTGGCGVCPYSGLCGKQR